MRLFKHLPITGSLIPLLLFLCSDSSAQLTEFSSTLNPVGSGARATGMGGAFIGVADDATAASWNPAGLIQLEKPEVSAVYSYFHREQEYGSEGHPEMNGVQTMDTDGLNYASFAYPFVLLNRNMILSINYQRLYEMNKEYRFPFLTASTSGSFTTISETGEEDFLQEGFLYALSPAGAVQITPNFYIGATYNVWDNFFGRNGWEIRSEQTQEKIRERFIGPPLNQTLTVHTRSEIVREEDNAFRGKNWHLGFLWALTESFTLGGVYKTGFLADFEKKVTTTTTSCSSSSFGVLPPLVCNPPAVDSETSKYQLRMPASYGIGLAYRHSDMITFALDVYRTDWSHFILRDPEENEKNPLTGANIRSGRLKDTTQVRFGTEYLHIKERNVIPLRFGLFYDPEPATGHIDDYYGFSFGTGLARDRLVFDISYQYRMGRNVTTDFPSAADSDPDIDQHTVMASLIFYLN